MNEAFVTNQKNQFCDLLRTLRIGQGISQEELANRAGMKRLAVTRIESGQHFPKGENLIALFAEVGIKLVPVEMSKSELQQRKKKKEK